MTHPDAVVALLSGTSQINAHFTSPPFHQRELKDPRIRTVLTTDDVLGGATTFTMLSTTARFREQNPQAYAAVLAALDEANAAHQRRHPGRRRTAVRRRAGRRLLGDGACRRAERPEHHVSRRRRRTSRNTPQFMHAIGSIEKRPASWRDLFFPEIHAAPGSCQGAAPLGDERSHADRCFAFAESRCSTAPRISSSRRPTA